MKSQLAANSISVEYHFNDTGCDHSTDFAQCYTDAHCRAAKWRWEQFSCVRINGGQNTSYEELANEWGGNTQSFNIYIDIW